MKTIITAILLFFCLSSQATNYYFSTLSGDDSRTSTQAQSSSTPWKSVTKLNSFFASLSPGDSVLFKRGEIFTGTITPTRNGTSSLPIIIGAYGTGSLPMITSLNNVVSWISLGNGVYESSATFTAVNLLLVNGTQKAYGRYPNATATSGGFDSILSHVGTTKITLYGVPASFIAGELVVKPKRWRLDRLGIQSRVGNTFTVTGATIEPTDKFGWFIQNSPSILDLPGEWCFYNSKVRLNSTTTPSGIQVATLSNLASLTSRSWIKFVNIEFNGSNSHAINLSGSTNIFFINCPIKNAGDCGVMANSSSNHITFTGDSILHAANNGIETNAGNISITNCYIDSTSMLAGMGRGGEIKGNGIACKTASDIYVGGTTVYHSGLNALSITNAGVSNNILVENNDFQYCAIVKDDAACIYTWNGNNVPPVSTNRIFRNNICRYAIGNFYGTGGSNFGAAQGIYCDVGGSDNLFEDNDITYNGRTGAYIHNGAQRNILHNNKIGFNGWNSGDGKGSQVYFNESDAARVIDNVVRWNEIWATDLQYLIRAENTGSSAFSNTLDSNFYSYATTKTTPFYTKSSLGTVILAFRDWKAKGHDTHGDTSTTTTNTVIRDLYATGTSLSYDLGGFGWLNAKKILFSGAFLTLSPYHSAIIKRTTITGNNPPSVILSSPPNGSTYTSPGTVIINASAFAQNSTITNVKFYANGTLLNTDASAPYSYTWTSVNPGTYTITAVALASNSLTGNSLPVQITVTNTPPAVSITSPTNGATYATGATVNMTATATDANASVSVVHFYVDGIFKGTDASSPYTASWVSTLGGHTLTAVAVDNLGDSTTSAGINITAFTSNTPPAVSITTPTADTAFQGPATINLIATASDADGTVSVVHFYDNGVFIHNETAAPWDYSQALSLGVHNITAVAKDNSGDSTTSAVRKVTITNIPPSISITSPVSDTSYYDPATIVINATATDDGSVSTVHFYKNGVYAGLDNSSPYTITLSSVVAGGYTLTVTAVDNLGDSTSATINVTVVTPVYIPPDTLSINVQVTTPVKCNGDHATVGVSATGGTEPYEFSSDGSTWQSGTEFSLPAAVYDLMVKDANDIRDTLRLSILPVAVVSATVSSDTIVSYGATVNKTINALGGTMPYTYSKDGVNYQSSNIFTLIAGSYTITVKDINGCTTTVSFTLTQPPPDCNCIINKKGKIIRRLNQ